MLTNIPTYIQTLHTYILLHTSVIRSTISKNNHTLHTVIYVLSTVVYSANLHKKYTGTIEVDFCLHKINQILTTNPPKDAP